MTDVREATDDLLAEKPDFESTLREVLAVDERTDGWTFEDVPLDSGAFGELVSRGIVVEDGDGYAVADPRAVRAGLDGEPTDADSDSTPTLPSISPPSVSRLEAAALAAALGFVVLMRTYIFPSVFRGEHVVLPSNDPYYYRYWVERLAAEATGVLDFSVLSGLPGAVAKGEPLMVGTLWWVTNLLGGPDAAGWVLAWYPVVSALFVGTIVYTIALRTTGDRRVGLTAVAFLAVIPAFAYRTGLGFADHHAFDYPWLALTAAALVWLADVDREALSTARPWFAAGALGVAVAGQVMAWEAGPLLIGALGVYVAVRAVADVNADRSPLAPIAPILAGLALASVLTHLAHTGFGWHTDVVAYAPALLFVGVAGVAVIAEAFRRVGMPAYVLATTELAGALSGLVAIQQLLPSYGSQLVQRTSYLLFRSGPAETRSIFAGGPSGFILGPILELGFAWLLGLPVLVWASWRAYHKNRSAWLVVTAYGWYFLVLASFQRRFVGELAPLFAVLAGWGFVALAGKIDVLDAPVFARERASSRPRRAATTDGGRSLSLPDRGTVTTLAIVFALLASAGVGQTAVRHEQVKIADEKFEAAQWIDQYAEDRGMEYPDNYVLTKWGRNRMYNHFVNGEAKSYAYANRNYEPFLSAKDPEAQYEQLSDRVGFVVTKNVNLPRRAPPDINYVRFHKRFGSAGDGASGAGHYRALYASDDGSIKVFELVPGANITGEGPAGETIVVSKRVEIRGAAFTYERRIEVESDGTFSVTVPYAGTYEVGDRTVEVSENAVRNGGNVTVES